MLVLTPGKGDRMGRFLDLSVTVDSSTMSPPSFKIAGTEGAPARFFLTV